MTAANDESRQRVTIWSVSPEIIGAYFGIFLIQYIPAIVFDAYTHIKRQEVDDALATTALEIIKASGPIGIGSAMNAIAIALSVEAIMVLARILSRQQRAEGHAEGLAEGLAKGVAEERKRSSAKLRAWAKEKGIPFEELPISDESEDDQ